MPAVADSDLSFPLLEVAKSGQEANGLRHSDHLRYRQYCSRRLARLYKGSQQNLPPQTFQQQPKSGKNAHSFVQSKPLVLTLKLKEIKEQANDAAFSIDTEKNSSPKSKKGVTQQTLTEQLEILLLNAERAWSHAAQLRSDNAVRTKFSAQLKNHSVRRLNKAKLWTKELKRVCEDLKATPRTVKECEAYDLFMQGQYHHEREDWSKSAEFLKQAKQIFEQLSLATQDASAYKNFLLEVEPLLKKCVYNAELVGEKKSTQISKNAEPEDSEMGPIIKEFDFRKGSQDYAASVKCRSPELVDRLTSILEKLQEMKSRKVKLEELYTINIDELVEAHGELGLQLQEILISVHGKMIANSKSFDLVNLEKFVRDKIASVYVERYLLLLVNLFGRLDEGLAMAGGVQNLAFVAAEGKGVKPEEGVRLVDLVVAELRKVIGSETEDVDMDLNACSLGMDVAGLEDMELFLRNLRGLFVGLSYLACGQGLQAAAVMDLVVDRIKSNDIRDITLKNFFGDNMDNCERILSLLCDKVNNQSHPWYSKTLVFLGLNQVSSEDKVLLTSCAGSFSKNRNFKLKTDDSKESMGFPHNIRPDPVALKPFFQDLAGNLLIDPALDERFRKQGKIAGALGKVAGWFTKR